MDKLSIAFVEACSQGCEQAVVAVLQKSRQGRDLQAGLVVNGIKAAAKADQTHMFALIIEKVCDHLLPFVQQGLSHALPEAARRGSLGTVRALLDLKDKHDGKVFVDVHVFGDIALRHACSNNHRAVAKLLLSLEGARFPDIAAGVQPALLAACSAGRTEIVHLMLGLSEEYGVHEYLTFALRACLETKVAPVKCLRLLLHAAQHSPSVVAACWAKSLQSGCDRRIILHYALLYRSAFKKFLQRELASGSPDPDPEHGEHDSSQAADSAITAGKSDAVALRMGELHMFAVIAVWFARTWLAGGDAARTIHQHMTQSTLAQVGMPTDVLQLLWLCCRLARWCGCGGLPGPVPPPSGHARAPPPTARPHLGRRYACLHRHAARSRDAPRNCK